jgi:hypothetical protein
MNIDRYNKIMWEDTEKLTAEDTKKGWHYCCEFDDLLVGPEMEGEWQCCTCFTEEEKNELNSREV